MRAPEPLMPADSRKVPKEPASALSVAAGLPLPLRVMMLMTPPMASEP